MRWGPHVRCAHAVERWYFPFLGIFSQILAHFWNIFVTCYGNIVFLLIPLGRRLYFQIKLSPSLFFGPTKAFFSWKLVNFCTLFSNFFPNFWPINPFFLLKISPKSLFFFFKLVNVWPLYSFFPQLLAQKILILFLSSAPACFFWPKKSFFSLELVYFWRLYSIFPTTSGPKNLFFSSSALAGFFLACKVLFL